MLLQDCCFSGVCASAFAGALLALTFARGLFWACFSCRATTSAEHLARSVLVAGLTKLTVRFAPAQQNPLRSGLLGSTLLSGTLVELLLLLRGLLGLLLLLRGLPPS